MDLPAKPKLSVIPYNPGVGELVRNKQKFSQEPNAGTDKQFRGWHERGYLPHRDAAGLTQFVTFHLSDSFPIALRQEWAALFAIEQNAERRKKLEEFLDRGLGHCYLRRQDVATLVENNLTEFSKKGHYELKAWVLMPNHVHVLFETGTVAMSEVVRSWKTHTGRTANRKLGRQGAFWAEDYFDTYMRDSEHEQRTIRYIENNPVKAKLVADSKAWPWSSARFRDEYGRFKLL